MRETESPKPSAASGAGAEGGPKPLELGRGYVYGEKLPGEVKHSDTVKANNAVSNPHLTAIPVTRFGQPRGAYLYMRVKVWHTLQNMSVLGQAKDLGTVRGLSGGRITAFARGPDAGRFCPCSWCLSLTSYSVIACRT